MAKVSFCHSFHSFLATVSQSAGFEQGQSIPDLSTAGGSGEVILELFRKGAF